MKKNELVHLHGLLLLLRDRFEERGEVDPSAFAAYDEMDVAPEQVYRRKEDHERAVLTLARVLADELSANGKYRGEEEPAGMATGAH